MLKVRPIIEKGSLEPEWFKLDSCYGIRTVKVHSE